MFVYREGLTAMLFSSIYLNSYVIQIYKLSSNIITAVSYNECLFIYEQVKQV